MKNRKQFKTFKNEAQARQLFEQFQQSKVPAFLDAGKGEDGGTVWTVGWVIEAQESQQTLVDLIAQQTGLIVTVTQFLTHGVILRLSSVTGWVVNLQTWHLGKDGSWYLLAVTAPTLEEYEALVPPRR